MLVIHPMTPKTHDGGLMLAKRHNLSIYDAMIAASALEADCDILWSANMQHGMVLDDRLRIANPFRAVSCG
jgi:predicted nucleic acid-binding protein